MTQNKVKKAEYDRKRRNDPVTRSKILATNAKYRLENSEKRNSYNREWYKKNKEAKLKSNKEWFESHRETTKEYDRKKSMKKRYGLSLLEYEDMLLEQEGKCLICGKPESGRRLSVDHNHETGEVRGLLCSNCNTVLGLVYEDVGILIGCIEYLEAFRSKEKPPSA